MKNEITYAVIFDGKVSNIIVCDDNFAKSYEAEIGAKLVRADNTDVYIGGDYDVKASAFIARPADDAGR